MRLNDALTQANKGKKVEVKLPARTQVAELDAYLPGGKVRVKIYNHKSEVPATESFYYEEVDIADAEFMEQE